MGRTSTVMEVQSTRTYDVLGRLVTVVAAATAPTGVTAAPAQSDYSLDAGGRITDVLGPGTGNPALRIRSHVDLDALGRTLATNQNADAVGGLSTIVSHTSYDPRGAITAWTPPTQQQSAGVATRTEFDLAGHSIRAVRNDLGLSPASDIKVTTSTGYDGYGRATDLTDPRGVVTHTDFDPLDRLSAVTLDPGSAPHLNLKTSYSYSTPGDLVTITRPRDGTYRTDQSGFDPLHRLASSTLNYSASPADWQTNVQTQYTYDSQGRVLTVQDPLGRYTRTDYDMLGRTIALTRNCVGTPAGTCNGTADWQTNVKTQWQVDKAGWVVAELSPRSGGSDSINLTTASSYDAQGRLTQVVEDSGASANGHLNLTTSYGYDPVGNRLTMTDGRTNTTTVTVDPLNRTTRVQEASSNLVQTQYSQASEVTASINGRGKTNSFTLDRLGRVLTQNYLKADGVTAGSLSFTYDPGGLVLSFATTDTPTTSVTYDAIGRVQSVGGPSSTSYTYFLDGTVKTVSDITGATNFGEDQLGRLSSTQDPLNGPTATTTYTVDASSRLTRRGEASGITTAFTYSGLDQLTQKTMTASGGTSPFANWSNTYDLAGNRLSENSVLPGDTFAGNATFSYDTVQRLLTATQPTQSTLTYGYDAAHNRTSVSGGTAPRGATSFAYLANEALTTETPTGQSTLPYSPDADGNITADAAGHQLKYDSLNRLQEVRDSTGATVLTSYAYDALGRPTKRTAGTAVTQFFYRGLEDKVVQEQDGSNAVLRSYAWDLNGRRLSVQTGGSLYTVATNPHGDVVGLMTGTGSVVGWTHFDPWGQVLGSSGTTIPFGYQGGFTDPLANFGFVRMGIRWYDPREGRFAREDPRGAMVKVSQPLAENLWDYGLDNPTNYRDPLGLIAIHDNCYRQCIDDAGAVLNFAPGGGDYFGSQPGSGPGRRIYWGSSRDAGLNPRPSNPFGWRPRPGSAGNDVVPYLNPSYRSSSRLQAANYSLAPWNPFGLAHPSLVERGQYRCALAGDPGCKETYQREDEDAMNLLMLLGMLVPVADEIDAGLWVLRGLRAYRTMRMVRLGVGAEIQTGAALRLSRATQNLGQMADNGRATQIYRYPAGSDLGPGWSRISVNQARAAAERNGIDTRMFDIQEAGPSPFGNKGYVTHTGEPGSQVLKQSPDRRFVLGMYDEGLVDERTAVGTIAHELNHVRGVLDSGTVTEEDTAEIPALYAEEHFR